MKELAAVLKSLSQLLGANDKSQARRNLRSGHDAGGTHDAPLLA